MSLVTLGVVRETKYPPDKRVPLTPKQCRKMLDRCAGLKILVQRSETRCFLDEEYRDEGITITEDLSGCDVLVGVKEVKIDALLNNKTYLFFSHTAKKQPYNRDLLRAVIGKGIRLVDYEYLTDQDMDRVVAFGRWAGMVGAYNGLRAYSLRFGDSPLKPASLCLDLGEIKSELQKLDLGKTRITITGGGRVAGGATEILDSAGIFQVSPVQYLHEEYGHAVYTRLDPWHYTNRKDGSDFNFNHFIAYPEMYENSFRPYAARTHLFVACHFWDPESPILLSREDLTGKENLLSIIADISCDINGPIPSTIRASTIADPFYGYDPFSGKETDPFKDGSITVMAVDNLPGELPRDASTDFGETLMDHVLPELLGQKDTGMLNRASITSGGELTEAYAYLQSFLDGKE